MFKPVFPYIKNAVNHLVFYKQHMATVHIENGKYHVHVEVTKNAKEDNSNKNTPSSKKENTSTDHVVIINKEVAHIIILTFYRYPLPANDDLLAGNIAYNYPPPRI